MNETEAQRKEQEWIENEYDEGCLEGYEADPNKLPSWWYDTVPARLTARQRGYWYGREIKVQEMTNA
jgi:hypothetical protein